MIGSIEARFPWIQRPVDDVIIVTRDRGECNATREEVFGWLSGGSRPGV